MVTKGLFVRLEAKEGKANEIIMAARAHWFADGADNAPSAS